MNRQEMDNRFSSHVIDDAAKEKLIVIRRAARNFAHVIDNLCPESREKATALTQLSFSMMSATSSIAHQFPIDEREI